METFDLIIVGSGGGAKLALPAAHKGWRVALIERDAFGGTCLNRGCIPSKMLIHPADRLAELTELPRLNIALPAGARLDFAALVSRVSKTIDAISVQQAARHDAHPQLELIRGVARLTGPQEVAVGERRLRAPRIVLAVGSRPTLPTIPGLAGTPYMTSREALRRPDLPPRLIVLGGGYIACELGHVYAAAGSDVTWLVRSRLLRREDPEIQAEFARTFHWREQVHAPVRLESVTHADGIFTVAWQEADGKPQRRAAEALLVATGVEPATAELGVEQAGIRLGPGGGILVNDYLETHAPGIYALGDCLDRYYFRHTANFEADYLARRLFEGLEAPLAYAPVPHAVFTTPQVAGVGATQADLEQAGTPHFIGRARYQDANMGLARQSTGGLVKLLFHAHTQRLLGAQAIGPEAATLIHTAIAWQTLGATLADTLRMIYIHPALPELLRDAARDAAAQRPPAPPTPT